MKNGGIAPIVVILIALGVIILGGGGYYVAKKSGFIPRNEKNDIIKPLVGSNKIDTGDWKTYRNEKYGFEFRYPENDTGKLVGEVGEKQWNDGIVVSFYPLPQPIEFGPNLRIEIIPVKTSINMEAFVAEQTKNSIGKTDSGGVVWEFTYKDVGITNYNGELWRKFTETTRGDGPPDDEFVYLLVKNELGFKVSYSSHVLSNNKETFEKILSTFKFTK